MNDNDEQKKNTGSDLEQMGAKELAGFLHNHPEYADRCDWNRLAGLDVRDWAWLLRGHPEFADKCDWDRMRRELDGTEWVRLLRGHPEFAEHCDWSKLGIDDWMRLLKYRPNCDELVSRFDKWESLSLDTLCELLGNHPGLRNHCPEAVWTKFGPGHWAKLISMDHVYGKKMEECGAWGRVTGWCCPYHWAEKYEVQRIAGLPR